MVLIDYSAEEMALRRELRAYFAALMTDDVRRELGEGVGETPKYREVVSQMGRDGWLGFGWPTEYGGRGESAREQYVFFEEAQRAGVPVPLVTLNTVGPTLIRFGTDEQRQRFLPPILKGDVHFAIGYTEPEAGTDLAALTTRAVRDGDEYVVTGQKVFTTGGHDADFVWLAVRTDPDAPKHQGLSILIVDCTDPGFSSSPMWTMGRGRLSATYYDQVRVPASMLVGEENGGWRLLTAQLNHERVALAALGGRALGLFDDTLAWARAERLGDGSLVIDRPRVRAQFARLHARLEAMRILNWRVMCDMDDGQVSPARAAAVKVYGTEMMIEACRTLLEITGPAGAYKEGSSGAVMAGSLERAYRAAPVNTFGGGSNEVMRELIAQGLGLPRTQRLAVATKPAATTAAPVAAPAAATTSEAAETDAAAVITATRPRPSIGPDNAFFWAGVDAGEVRIQRCAGCATLRHPPRPMCPVCNSLEWDVVVSANRGTLFSFVVAHHPPQPGIPGPYVIALVELDEGVRLLANLVDIDPADVRVGLPVRVEFREFDGLRLPQFVPAGGEE